MVRSGALMHAPLHVNFYALFPHNLMAAMFGAVCGFAIFVLGAGLTHPWHAVSPAQASARSQP